MVGTDSSSDEDEEPEVIMRAEWQARPATRVRRFAQPPSSVVYSETETKTCTTRKECTELIQEMQNYHMDVRGLPDIQYHFLVGGDGNVYEGRGWDYVGNISPKDERFPLEVAGNVIEVAFIGDFKVNPPPKIMLKVASGLLVAGINNNKLIIIKKTDHMLTEEEVEELKKQGNVEIRGYGVDTPKIDVMEYLKNGGEPH